tara:strand:- start:1056 stop:1469 length:414 start_codon:yes stop_codon:yes gene_type:complete
MNIDLEKFTFNKTKSENLENKPRLVDNSSKYFFNGILRECNKFKQRNFNLYYNLSLFILFIIILGCILFFRYKGNLTKKQLSAKQSKDNNYIMSKLIYYNRQNIDNQQRINNNLITNLPDYGNHPEANLLHKKVYFN